MHWTDGYSVYDGHACVSITACVYMRKHAWDTRVHGWTRTRLAIYTLWLQGASQKIDKVTSLHFWHTSSKKLVCSRSKNDTEAVWAPVF